jgi:hypothetical protein
LKAANGNSEKGAAVYNIEKKVCASESNGLSTFLKSSVTITTATNGISIRKLSPESHPAKVNDETGYYSGDSLRSDPRTPDHHVIFMLRPGYHHRNDNEERNRMEPQPSQHAYHNEGTGNSTPDKIGHLTDL